MEDELELNRLKEQETVERRTNGIALKTSIQHDTSEEEENLLHDETLSLLTRKFTKFLKWKSRDKTQQRKRYSKPNESNYSHCTCFGCGKPGHIKVDCPTIKIKKNQTAKRVKEAKGKKHTSPGRKMKYPHQVIPELKVKQQIYASW